MNFCWSTYISRLTHKIAECDYGITRLHMHLFASAVSQGSAAFMKILDTNSNYKLIFLSKKNYPINPFCWACRDEASALSNSVTDTDGSQTHLLLRTERCQIHFVYLLSSFIQINIISDVWLFICPLLDLKIFKQT